MMQTVYPSKRDLWLTIIIGLAVLLLLAVAVSLWMQPVGWETRLIVTGLLAVPAMFILDLLMRTEYILSHDELFVRCGFLRWRVPYASIESIQPSRTLLSGPALSLDRLMIRCEGRKMPLVISPADQRQFLDELADRVEGLKNVGGTIRRDGAVNPGNDSFRSRRDVGDRYDS